MSAIYFDLPSVLFLLTMVVVGGRLLEIPPIMQLVLVFHCFLPFGLNDVLFPSSYMSDQFKYLKVVNDVRAGEVGILNTWLRGGSVEKAGVLLSIIPVPFAHTTTSLGFFNKFVFILIFCWLYAKGVLTRFSAWFYLLYPSYAMYSGLALRDALIFSFMVVAFQMAREGRYFLLVFSMYPLLGIKFQNFFILLLVFFIYFAFRVRRGGLSVTRGLGVALFGIVLLIAVSPLVLPLINLFRAAMFVEDGGGREHVQMISSAFDFGYLGFKSGIYFLIKPLPWEASNLLQLIQSIENIGVAGLLFALSRVAIKNNLRRFMFWGFFLFIALSIYGLVVFNYGTAARYRFPFILIFVIFVCADCQVRSVFSKILPDSWRVSHSRVLHASKVSPRV